MREFVRPYIETSPFSPSPLVARHRTSATTPPLLRSIATRIYYIWRSMECEYAYVYQTSVGVSSGSLAHGAGGSAHTLGSGLWGGQTRPPAREPHLWGGRVLAPQCPSFAMPPQSQACRLKQHSHQTGRDHGP